MKRFKLLKKALVFLALSIIIISCASDKEFKINIDKETALRMYKMRIRKYIIDFDLKAACEYSNDLIQSMDKDFRALGKLYINHLAEVYYTVAGRLEESGKMKECMAALISAEALNPDYIKKNNNFKISLIEKLIKYYYKKDDKENAFLLYELLLKARPDYSDPLLKQEYERRNKSISKGLKEFVLSVSKHVPTIEAKYAYIDDGTRKIYTSRSLGYIIEENLVLALFHTLSPTVAGIYDGASYQIYHKGGVYGAELHSYDGISDLALLKVTNGSVKPLYEFGQIVGNSDDVKKFERLYGAGVPAGSENIEIFDQVVSKVQGGFQIGNWMQFDGVYLKEYSGAPIFNRDKELVAFLASGPELTDSKTYILPVNYLRMTLHSLKTRKSYPYSWLGIMFVPQSPGSKTLRVRHVYHNSPAYLAGIKEGDLLTSVNHRKVERVSDAQDMISMREAGSVCALGINRGGRQKTYYLVTAHRPYSLNYVGFAPVSTKDLASLNFGFDYIRERRSSCRVLKVHPSSLAEDLGFLPEEEFELLYDAIHFGRQIMKVRYFHKADRGDYKEYILKTKTMRNSVL